VTREDPPPPATAGIRLEVVAGTGISSSVRTAILSLSARAFEEDVEALYDTMTPVAHVLAWTGPRLGSHAMWVDRWIAVGSDEPRRTAYVEFVATEPSLQGRGLGTAVMERLAVELDGAYPVAGLCTGSPGFYARLGWWIWRGPLGIRRPSGGILPTPGEIVMVLDLDGSLRPRLDERLSAEWREGELW
jgi:aminoglycoside 2'-N-acetyltransferase I